jgi:hypothetical protein
MGVTPGGDRPVHGRPILSRAVTRRQPSEHALETSRSRAKHGPPVPCAATTESDRGDRMPGRSRWIDQWEPENEQFWETTGQGIARKNLAFSIFAEHLGFSIWVLWAIVVINLGNAGITLSLPEQFWLTAVPNLVGSTLRIPYTFAVPLRRARLDGDQRVAPVHTDDPARDRGPERLARGPEPLHPGMGPARRAPPRPDSAAATSRRRWRTSRSSIPRGRRGSHSV